MSGAPSHRKHIRYQSGLLGGFALLCTALLIFGNLATHAVIERRLDEDLRGSLERVIPASLYTNNLLENPLLMMNRQSHPVPVYRAIRDFHVSAVAFRVVGNGYGGKIELILGADSDGRILGVRVLSHAETPGLGDRIEEGKSEWILGFNGRSLENTTSKQWHVRKDGGDFDEFTGATITPRGVVKAVHEGLNFFQQHRGELLAVSPDKNDPTAQEMP